MLLIIQNIWGGTPAGQGSGYPLLLLGYGGGFASRHPAGYPLLSLPRLAHKGSSGSKNNQYFASKQTKTPKISKKPDKYTSTMLQVRFYSQLPCLNTSSSASKQTFGSYFWLICLKLS
jgi:hypothetical protein